MGCSSSKRIESAAADVYKPPPSSFAVFDINSIQEPWLDLDGNKNNSTSQQDQEKQSQVPVQLLEKLNKLEDAPRSWDEVSKALEDLKPTLNDKNPPKLVAAVNTPQQFTAAAAAEKKQAPCKRVSFHTLEELDQKLMSSKLPENKELRKSESMRTEFKKTAVTNVGKNDSRVATEPESVIKPVKENVFIIRDRLEREKDGKTTVLVKRDPLSEYPELCPPGGTDSVVVYTTSLRGVRRTFEDCTRVRTLLEGHHVALDERDVSLHGAFLNELKELLGESGGGVPRVFVKGRYIGGAEEVVELNESGRLGRILSSASVERVVTRQACEGCGGARFVPCLACGGSCKVLVGAAKERCATCNENGLVRCPTCL